MKMTTVKQDALEVKKKRGEEIKGRRMPEALASFTASGMRDLSLLLMSQPAQSTV